VSAETEKKEVEIRQRKPECWGLPRCDLTDFKILDSRGWSGGKDNECLAMSSDSKPERRVGARGRCRLEICRVGLILGWIIEKTVSRSV
jgi:hypothetical protein